MSLPTQMTPTPSTPPGQSAPDGGQDSRLPSDPGEELFSPAPAHRPVGFFRQPWVQNVLPFATSLVFHSSIIIVGILLFKPIEHVMEVVKEQIIIPESAMADNGPPGGIPHPGLGGDPTRDAAQDIEKSAPDSQSWSSKASSSLNQAVMGGAGDSDATAMIAVGANTAGGRGGNAIGGSDGEGGLAAFGLLGGGGGAGPKSSFAGTGGNAKKVMYLCDASGSMLSVFGQLRHELKKSIDSLKPIQSFNVIFFNDEVTALDRTAMMMANPANKRLAYDFVDTKVQNAGGTLPIPAIKMALAQQPELIYVLTDGFENANLSEVVDAFAKGNPDKKIHVNCIYLDNASPDGPQLIATLRKITKDNGGLLKVFSKNDF